MPTLHAGRFKMLSLQTIKVHSAFWIQRVTRPANKVPFFNKASASFFQLCHYLVNFKKYLKMRFLLFQLLLTVTVAAAVVLPLPGKCR